MKPARKSVRLVKVSLVCSQVARRYSAWHPTHSHLRKPIVTPCFSASTSRSMVSGPDQSASSNDSAGISQQQHWLQREVPGAHNVAGGRWIGIPVITDVGVSRCGSHPYLTIRADAPDTWGLTLAFGILLLLVRPVRLRRGNASRRVGTMPASDTATQTGLARLCVNRRLAKCGFYQRTVVTFVVAHARSSESCCKVPQHCPFKSERWLSRWLAISETCQTCYQFCWPVFANARHRPAACLPRYAPDRRTPIA